MELAGEVLQDLRARWAHARYLLIDEISMVGHDMLVNISRRLSEIRQCALPFGGVSVLCVGDLYQLKPVEADCVFLGGGAGSPSLEG